MFNSLLLPLLCRCCSPQGVPADGTAVLSNMFVKALHQQGGIARPNSIIYIRDNLSLYFSMLDKQYSHLIGNFDPKPPN